LRLSARIGTILDRVLAVLAVTTAITLVFAWLSVSVEVAIRNLGGHPLGWVIEFAEYTMLYISFAGAAWVLKKEGHVSLDIVANRLRPKARNFLNIITSVLGAIVCLVIAWYSVEVTWDLFQRGVRLISMVEPPQAPFIAIIAAGSFLLFVQFLRRAYGYLEDWREG